MGLLSDYQSWKEQYLKDNPDAPYIWDIYKQGLTTDISGNRVNTGYYDDAALPMDQLKLLGYKDGLPVYATASGQGVANQIVANKIAMPYSGYKYYSVNKDGELEEQQFWKSNKPGFLGQVMEAMPVALAGYVNPIAGAAMQGLITYGKQNRAGGEVDLGDIAKNAAIAGAASYAAGAAGEAAGSATGSQVASNAASSAAGTGVRYAGNKIAGNDPSAEQAAVDFIAGLAGSTAGQYVGSETGSNLLGNITGRAVNTGAQYLGRQAIGNDAPVQAQAPTVNPAIRTTGFLKPYQVPTFTPRFYNYSAPAPSANYQPPAYEPLQYKTATPQYKTLGSYGTANQDLAKILSDPYKSYLLNYLA